MLDKDGKPVFEKYPKIAIGFLRWIENMTTAKKVEEFGGIATKNYTIKPAKVRLNEVSSNAPGSLYASWINDGTADGYEILLYSSRRRGYSSTVSKFTIDGNESETTVNDLIEGNRYSVYVRAYKLIDGKKVYGRYSSAKSVTIKKNDYGFGFGFGFGYSFAPWQGFGRNPYFGYGNGGAYGYYPRPYAVPYVSGRMMTPYYYWLR